jgi:hydroxyacylglutathione hydrolase
MILERVKSKVVSQISYFLGSDDEAIVIDPRRDCQIYVELAKREGMNIKFIFETHRNEDYVVGSQELSHITGAKIYHGSQLAFRYGKSLTDGQEFYFGELKINSLHTPGHTPESFCYAVTDLDSGDYPVMVFTGDTLFVGDVGRTDFGGPEKRRDWSEKLFDSIFNKLLPLGDHVILLPAHGAGSVCGEGIAEREHSTIGIERLMNPILQKTKKEFIDYLMSSEHHYAPYYKTMERINLQGAPFVGHGPNPKALDPNTFLKQIEKGAIMVDLRSPVSFGGGHIKNSYSIPLKRLQLGGSVLPYDKPLLLILQNQSQLDYVTKSLTRLGYDNVSGYLQGGFNSWYTASLPINHLSLLTAENLKEKIDNGEQLTLLDVRSKNEWLNGHIKNVIHIYVGVLEKFSNDVPKDKPIAVICKTGTRASLASSILLREGRTEVFNLLGGMVSWRKAGYSVTK